MLTEKGDYTALQTMVRVDTHQGLFGRRIAEATGAAIAEAFVNFRVFAIQEEAFRTSNFFLLQSLAKIPAIKLDEEESELLQS